jgi:hypothetical protein
VEFIKNRQMFKNKTAVENNLLQTSFFDKYNNNPVEFNHESLLQYDPQKPMEKLLLNNNKKIFIINSFIGLINSITSGNHYLITINPLLYRTKNITSNTENPDVNVNHEEEKKKKNSKKSKKTDTTNENITTNESSQWEAMAINNLNWKQILWNDEFDNIKLNKIIDYYFFGIDEDTLGIKITQEYTINDEKKYVKTILHINDKNNLLLKINDIEILNFDESFKEFFGVPTSIDNLNMITTIFSILSSIENKNNKNILMMKNIKPNLYTQLINYYSYQWHLSSIKNITINLLVDNLYRCYFMMEVINNGVTKLVESIFDFECPNYSFPELITIYNKNGS